MTSVRSGIIKFLTFMVQGEGCCAAKYREINLRRTLLSDTMLLSHSSTGFPGVTLSGSKALLWHLYRIATPLQLMSSYISTSPSWTLMGSSMHATSDATHPILLSAGAHSYYNGSNSIVGLVLRCWGHIFHTVLSKTSTKPGGHTLGKPQKCWDEAQVVWQDLYLNTYTTTDLPLRYQQNFAL